MDSVPPEAHPLSQLYGSLEASAGIGSWRYHFKSKHLVWSRGVYDLLGLPETVKPSYDLFAKFTHPDDRLPVDNLDSYLNEVRTIDREFRLIDTRGMTRWVSHKAEVLVDDHGQRILACGILIDISARLNALNERDATERRLRALSQSIAKITWTADANGNMPASQGWMDLTGQGPKDCSGLGWLDAICETDREAIKRAWLEARETKTQFRAKYCLKTRDGKLRRFLAQCVPMFDDKGDVRNWLGALIDIDDLERPNAHSAPPAKLNGLRGRDLTGARALVGWSLQDLANNSGLSFSTVRRIEELSDVASRKDVALKIVSILQHAGVEFRQDGEGWFIRTRQ